MTVFSIGITAIFVLLTQTMKASVYSRNEVVVANLLREQIELVRNIRDTNLAMYAPWDKARINNGAITSLTGSIAGMSFVIENNFTQTGVEFETSGTDAGTIKTSPVTMSGVVFDSSVVLDEFGDRAILEQKFNATRLYFDDQKRYTHAVTLTGTQFASYVILSPIGYLDTTGTFSGITITDENNNNKPQ